MRRARVREHLPGALTRGELDADPSAASTVLALASLVFAYVRQR